jgi:hypothetical protein
MGFSVEGLLGIRAFGYMGFSVLKPTFAAELWENKIFAAELWENKIFAAE